MIYKALKPVRFDRNYCVGEDVPERVIDPYRVGALLSMGMLARMASIDSAEIAQEPPKKMRPKGQ